MPAEPKRTARKPSGPVSRRGGGKKREGNLAEFFLNSPLRGADIDLERVKDQPREIDLGGAEAPAPKRT
jgi:hypothetical protein